MSLRVLMVLVAVVAGCLAWETNRARRQREAVAAIEAAGGSVQFNWQSTPGEKPGWLRRHLGPGFFEEVVEVAILEEADDALMTYIGRLPHLRALFVSAGGLTDAGLAHLTSLRRLERISFWGSEITDLGPLCHLSRLKELDLSGTRIDDAGLVPVENLHALWFLKLGSTEISNAGLKSLVGLSQLELLDLSDTRITDAGLVTVGGLTEPRYLDLNNTCVTDAGLHHLANLQHCHVLHVKGTKVTPEGIAAMKAKCPWMTIYR